MKFRAPGVTVALGLGIGRLVFRALNRLEVLLAVVLVTAGAAGGMSRAGWVLVVGLAGILAVQVLLLRPRLDRRAEIVVAGRTPPAFRLHLSYITLEVAKVLMLVVIGVLLATRSLP